MAWGACRVQIPKWQALGAWLCCAVQVCQEHCRDLAVHLHNHHAPAGHQEEERTGQCFDHYTLSLYSTVVVDLSWARCSGTSAMDQRFRSKLFTLYSLGALEGQMKWSSAQISVFTCRTLGIRCHDCELGPATSVRTLTVKPGSSTALDCRGIFIVCRAEANRWQIFARASGCRTERAGKCGLVIGLFAVFGASLAKHGSHWSRDAI